MDKYNESNSRCKKKNSERKMNKEKDRNTDSITHAMDNTMLVNRRHNLR